MENKKYAFISGASGGIGTHIARELARDYNLILHTRSKKDILLKLKEEIEDREVLIVEGDLSKFEDCKDIFEKCQGLDVDVLVNNAGITKDNLIFRMSPEDFTKVIETNLNSAFYLSKLFARPMMKRRNGKIINISSISGIKGNPGQANYSASKAGLIALTKTLAKELGGKNILVNAVAPGFIKTKMTEDLSDDLKTEMLNNTALKRFGNAYEVAKVIRFLASEDASYITGQVISVDGGLNTWE